MKSAGVNPHDVKMFTGASTPSMEPAGRNPLISIVIARVRSGGPAMANGISAPNGEPGDGSGDSMKKFRHVTLLFRPTISRKRSHEFNGRAAPGPAPTSGG